MLDQNIAEQISKNGLCITPNFLSASLLVKLQQDMARAYSINAFTKARTGLNKEMHNIRQDETHWLDRENTNSVQQELWALLDGLKLSLNRNLFLGISSFEGHYSSYPIGGFYKRHIDCFQNNNARIVSLVLYLNQNWSTENAGCLRIYHETTHTDIDPIGGTLVCFLSKETEHEVLTTNAIRNSFTGWFT